MTARPRAAALRLLPALTLPLAGCSGPQAMLDAAGAHARHVATLWWVMLGLSVLIWLGITLALAIALLRRRNPDEDPHHHARTHRRERAIVAGVAVVVVALAVILAHTMWVERATAHEMDDDALVIEVVGRQWWWDVHYRGAERYLDIRTSNQINIPVGRTIELRLRSADVIHSFWTPSLHGKVDMLPGRTNLLRLKAERVGVYRAQCAEFCGIQHAKMALEVVVQSADDFARWAERERAPAVTPADSLARIGHDVFMGRSCVLCHQVRGTIANAVVGPDLTHIASRRTLAAGTLPNRRGHLAGWILDPQHIKPGSLMPATQLDGDELHALLHYLESLR